MIKLIQGDTLTVLKTLPDNHVHCVVTSPPYWGLRDYGVKGQLGLEPTMGEYVQNMVEVFREVRRVLRKDGTCFLNLGDSYCGSGGAGGDYGPGGLKEGQPRYPGKDGKGIRGKSPKHCDGVDDQQKGLKAKDLCGIPWRVALALQDDGWWLRSDLIWHKPNPMPESVRDRPTRSHEYIFLLTKSAKYFWDQEATKELCSTPTDSKARQSFGGKKLNNEQLCHSNKMGEKYQKKENRNIRTVWSIPTQPFKGAHFATFPLKLVERCVAAGTPDEGVVLDPFGGSMTTALVAGMMQRDAICIELNPDYVKMGAKRIQERLGMLADLEIISVGS